MKAATTATMTMTMSIRTIKRTTMKKAKDSVSFDVFLFFISVSCLLFYHYDGFGRFFISVACWLLWYSDGLAGFDFESERKWKLARWSQQGHVGPGHKGRKESEDETKRKQLLRTWAFNCWDFTRQPIDEIYAYFGTKVKADVLLAAIGFSIQMALEWGDGYYNGDIKTRKTIQAVEFNADQLGLLQRSEQLRELYESLAAGESSPQARRPSAALSPKLMQPSFQKCSTSFNSTGRTDMPCTLRCT
ncbi:hypothetical protein RHMOL_Rhmol09G0131400 [Rhododendron molle]|uniref:Uncharacterized protein n=4 Tax=Rhododendron molle TaxID=49168 RepID=A0ACC0MEQ4_RHOML|nr:hypothetical protein RHMOL_Rhmol09G0131400 [Rhododendron molle]KAI8538795.1 hypothetical protein RHMOL_Rhmol09G0131400 [Rhododendron molle]KAI8538797.1 hypothetical protein RHMOL_Rhmol09G0131400 [Rhododendron molle]KAI8538798.1 hypothetical protein RHMOL_Rhmol09G0131400 [Rhododendron molle]